jgi:hypothetical protein
MPRPPRVVMNTAVITYSILRFVTAPERVASYLNRLKVKANIIELKIVNENKKLVGLFLTYTDQMSSPKAD